MAAVFAQAPEPVTELGRFRVLSSTAGIRTSPLALGGMSIGSAWADLMGSMDKAASFALLDAYAEAGGNLIDTANNYQDEESELWIGEWMAARRNRDRLVLATKYTSDFGVHALGKNASANHHGNSRRSLRMSLAASLRKLRTDYVDVLYLHWWDWTTSVKEVMDSLHVLVEQGTVLYLGVSDTPAWVVSAANTYAVAHGKTPFSIYQGRWNVLVRDLEREVLPMARQFGMAVAPWDVLGGGRFQTARALDERRARGEGVRTLVGPHAEGRQSDDDVRVSAALERVAAEHGVESITAIALAYVLAKGRQQRVNVVPIVGGRKVEYLKDNIKALSIKLTEEQVQFLESVKPFDLGFPVSFLGEDPNITGYSKRLDRSAKVAFPNATPWQ